MCRTPILIGKKSANRLLSLTPLKHTYYCFIVPFRHKIKYRLRVFYEWALAKHAADEGLFKRGL